MMGDLWAKLRQADADATELEARLVRADALIQTQIGEIDRLTADNARLTERLATTHRTIANLNHRLLTTDDNLYTELHRVLVTLRELNGMWSNNVVINLSVEIARVEDALAKAKGDA